ncbi:GNAT family N-acetyltransferase [Tateyamaria sp. ANG-S1]|uniref:GNAT family N-acetyltransferase n=1 Tax=Tateyamaria sp. ANG-S1 TaxID=1577905 RepID=UPI00057D39A9|nr:GNAT family N-acetyltransferase [Tateyamaria sp. ANG-S1]KIC51815.1 GCN5 family acetyltransferase [Tateyamaria sp. ANG-S1]
MLADGHHDVPKGKVAMVVTDLEMTTPQYRGAPCPDGLTLKPMMRAVGPYLELFRRVGGPWLWYGRTIMPEQELHDILVDPDTGLYTLEKDGQPEALLELDFSVKGACELDYFGLTSALIGTGAGAYLMDRAIEFAFARDITRFHLHTCTIDSPQALGFYRRSGFTPIGQRIEIADDPRIAHGYPRDSAPHVPIIDP